jgi:RNA polymerase subunit RPABC4/transcription elongation factor Spt4
VRQEIVVHVKTDVVHLDEFTREEWKDIVISILPETSDREFDQMWNKFMALKRRRTLQ